MMCFDLAVGCCLSPGPISTKDAAEFTLLPGDQERYGDKDGGIGSGDDTNQDDSGKLPDGWSEVLPIGHDGKRFRSPAGQVLPQPVKHNDGIVDGVADNS